MSSLYAILLVVLLIIIIIAAYHYASLGKFTGGGDGDYEMFGAGLTRLFLSDPDYTSAREGKKTVDARICRPPFSNLSKGDTVVVVRSRPHGDTTEYPGGEYKFKAEITAKKEYASIKELIKDEGLKKVYPDHSEKEAIELFHKYLPKDAKPDEKVVAFHFAKAR